MAELLRLVQSMHESLGDLEADFERSERLLRDQSDNEEVQLRLLGQLERLVGICAGRSEEGDCSKDAAVIATSEEIDAAQRMLEPMVFSHEVKLDRPVQWLAVSSETSGYVGNRLGRVVPADSAGDRRKRRKPLPQPCIFASFLPNRKHLLVLSVDGSRKLRCRCDIDWRKVIWGLHCDRQLLFIAQPDAVTVTDLSGRAVRRVRPHIEDFGDIKGIGGNAASVFVSSGNKIAAFSKATWQMETVITLSQLPRADLRNLATHDNCILVTEFKHDQVHRVSIDTQQLVASFPTQSSRLKQFVWPLDVAVDSRGRLLVSELWGHSVRAVAADDGSLLWTLGTSGESGSGDGRFNRPWGLAVVTGSPREQLVVADRGNMRLQVFSAS
ncbi:hypothetical protein BOX15_Mlig000014g1 [Macrostomum lignano]|uniref:Uncharacterized protein n=1 Tax=Macrostomum lignano TaxID=282301 RepID=A0A267GIE2_9PLAT|nr:hypothetical protein BOX15_Mlig000014g1 [Macrostomum lignano]